MGVGRKENLKPLDKRTKEEQRAVQRMGGKASGEARRRKKTMREALEMLMYDTELSETVKEMLRADGIDSKDMNHQMVITRSLIAKAESGDVQAYNAICAMIGEKPAEKMEMSGSQNHELTIKYITQSQDDENFPSSEAEVDV